MISPEVAHHFEYGVALGILAMAFSRTVRMEVYRRQRGKCDATGEHFDRLQTHHRLPHCMGGTDDIENAVGLCPKAHKEADKLAIKTGVIYPQKHYKDGYYPDGKHGERTE